MRESKLRLLTKKEILMPTWGRVLFTLIPLIWGMIVVGIYLESEFLSGLFDLFGTFSVFLIVSLTFATLFLVMPFQLVLDPIGWWSHDIISGPTEEGFVVVIVGYMIIFYFLFPTRKIVRQELKRMFGRG